jgi:hypothetical protein
MVFVSLRAASKVLITSVVSCPTAPPCQARMTARHSPRTVLIQSGVQPSRRPASRAAPKAVGSRLDHRGQPGQVLRPGQLEIQVQLAGADQVADQRPGPGTAQLLDPLSDRSAHPVLQVRVAAEELPRDPQSVTQRPVTQAQRREVGDIAGEQRGIGWGRDPGHGGGHRRMPSVVARAAAYSAASCSTDRCT